MVKHHSPGIILLLVLVFLNIVESYSSPVPNQNEKQMIVIIDPGHGGKDPGAVNNGVREKDVVLGVGLKLGKLINENFPDIKVIYTRNTDVFVPLIDRSRIANKSKANLFISIHANTCGSPSTRGTETFTLGLHRSNENLDVAKKENAVILLEDNYSTTYEGFDPNSSESYIMFELTQDIYMDQSISFADDIQHQFHNRTEGSNRGVKQAGFLVLRQSSMPSVLIETGFVSNPAEAKYLNSDEGQQTIAFSVLEAFRKFKSRNSTGNVTSKAENKPVHIVSHVKSVERPDTSLKIVLNETKIDTNLAKNIPEKSEIQQVEKLLEKSDPAKVAKQENAKEEKEVNIELAESNLPENNSYYSVQIGANTNPVNPVPSNFKGLKNVRREKMDKYFRYYVGKESSLENITVIMRQIKDKFPQAFIVSFTNGKRTIIDSTTK
jgi:N-acetylmuramoyl-L-alanine amidase